MKILVAIDASEASQIAVREVLARPWPDDTHVDVLHVVEPLHLWATSDTAEELNQQARRLVDEAGRRLADRGLKTTAMLIAGDPKRAILERARSTNADLIVTGSHSASAVTRMLLGNVAASVVRHADCAVEVVRAPASGEERHPVRRILLATDGSEYSEMAAKSIASRPWPEGAEVRLLSAVEFILPRVNSLLEPPFIHSAEVQKLRTEAMQRAQTSIARAGETLSGTPLKVSESISVLLEKPKDVILKEADAWDADLIVVGSHGRSGVEHFLLGSVSETIATHAHCSVEVIHKPAA